MTRPNPDARCSQKRRMLHMPKALLCAALLFTAGCEAAISTNAAIATATAAFIINEDKLPTDVVAAHMTGLDCNSIRAQRDKGPVCRPYREEIIDPPVYCYKTLGSVDCFNRPDPYGYNQEEIN